MSAGIGAISGYWVMRERLRGDIPDQCREIFNSVLFTDIEYACGGFLDTSPDGGVSMAPAYALGIVGALIGWVVGATILAGIREYRGAKPDE